jgi:aminoglycoside 2'-N-acetyltransferase I
MPEVHVLRTDDVSVDLLTRIRALLDAAFDDYSDDDWTNALGGWHVVVEDGDEVVAHAAVVDRIIDVDGAPTHIGYVESVATHPARRHQGLGTAAMQEIATIIERDFEMGALSTSKHAFYERLGWRRWRGPTFVRRGDEVVRTPGEDDGVMVLAPKEVDLTVAITCEARQGDDW